MHKSPTLLLISAKKSAMGDAHPDYSGKMGGARVLMPDDMPGSPCDMADTPADPDPGPDTPTGYRTKLTEIKKELQKASKMHARQAETIESMLSEGEDSPESPGQGTDGDDDSYGEKKELE
mgnify:CR=1 FL=1